MASVNIKESYLYDFDMGKEDIRRLKYYQEQAQLAAGGSGNKETLTSALLALGGLAGYFYGPIGTVAGAVGSFLAALNYVTSGDKRLIQGSISNGLKDLNYVWNNWFRDYEPPLQQKADRVKAHVTLMDVEYKGETLKFVTSVQVLSIMVNGSWQSYKA